MTVDSKMPRTRRAVLAASIGGLAAFTAQAMGRPLAVHAADGAYVTVGDDTLTGLSVTKITTTNATAIWGYSTGGVGVGIHGSSDNLVGVLGQGPVGVSGTGAVSGVEGDSEGGTGVEGRSVHARGILGVSTEYIGVSGYSTNHTGLFGEGALGGVRGNSTGAGFGVFGTGAQGVIGVSGAGPGSFPAKTGVYGHSTIDANSRGVFGQSSSGQGVRGVATTGRGVHGEATSGIGVRSYATSGTALLSEATTGYALRTKGRVRFDDSAGIATIATGNISVAVTPGVDLTTTSAVVATLMGSAGGKTTVHRVSINATANTFTIYLTANSTAAVKIAWFVFG